MLVFRYEALSWIPSLVVFVVMVGVGGKSLVQAPIIDPTPVPTGTLFTFGATLAANIVSWAPLTPDYGVHHNGDSASE